MHVIYIYSIWALTWFISLLSAPPPSLIRFSCAPPAAVGVFVLHDKNNDGRANTNWLGVPEEGMTASNDARGGFPVGHPCGGNPCWDEAKMAVDAAIVGCVIIDMPMWYP